MPEQDPPSPPPEREPRGARDRNELSHEELAQVVGGLPWIPGAPPPWVAGASPRRIGD